MTRADFYIGKERDDLEWLGSIPADGYPCSKYMAKERLRTIALRSSKSDRYRKNVSKFLLSRDDATVPEQGWPWPWNDSRLTDFAYTFYDEKVHVSYYGSAWMPLQDFILIWEDDDATPPSDEKYSDHTESRRFPNMKSRQVVTYGRRSGVIVFGRSGIV